MSATTALVATMSCGQAMLPAAAVTVPEEASVPSLVQEDVDLQAVEAEVTTIFERYLQQDSEGRWSVNVEAVRQNGAPEAELQRIAERFNVPIGKYVFPGSEDKGAGGKGASPRHRFDSGEWGKCVLGALVPSFGAVVTKAMRGGYLSLLTKGQYAKVVSHLIRVVGPAALKEGLKAVGGTVGLIGFLAGAAAWCASPWA
jgi:hypothetical protein